MVIVLRYLDPKIEEKFRAAALKKYGNHKAHEKNLFQDLVIFIDDEKGQELYEKWVSQRDDPYAKKK